MRRNDARDKGVLSVMTEEQIERLVERRMDGLDRAYLSSGMTEAEYNREVAALDLEAKRLLALVPRGL